MLNKILTITIALFLFISCEVEDGENLNGADTTSISSDISRGELGDAIGGVFSDMRQRLGTQVDAMSVVGREYWRIASSDPRWTGDLLTGVLDDNTFYTTTPYAGRYATVKDINLILDGLDNTTADFSEVEKAATRGLLNTIKAHEFLMVLNMQFENGIRTDVSDSDNLGGFNAYDESLAILIDILNSAAEDLDSGGEAFPFPIPAGFEGFGTPSTFNGFNKALAARIAAYQGDYPEVLSYLGDSFLDLEGDLAIGAYFTFSLTGADLANPLFFAQNSTVANVRIAHPTFISEAEADDDRLEKAPIRNEPLSNAGLTGAYDVFVYKSNIDPVGIIRNEELVLLNAEANHITNPSEAINSINIVRNAAGLPDYSGGSAPSDLVEEILQQRRYSLFAEGGHRWIDLRRFGRLDELPLDRTGDNTVTQFPTPQNENR